MNETPLTTAADVFRREPEPPEMPARAWPVKLPTIVVFVKGGLVQGVYATWPARVIVCDGDDGFDPSSDDVLESEELGAVEVRPQPVETDRKAQRLVAEVLAFAERDRDEPICHPAEAGSE